VQRAEIFKIATIAFKEGIDHLAFSMAITLAFIVVLDVNSLRC
jgi:acid phosphatase family membrane protein YuiD